ncbi:MAG: di-trans,poly-cis-decaprenylcistransferase [Candidatus Stahlbacteria bacterium]|jgi:undecaprenyl diphosphate synthase|nr:di-trans,poly-cis-decaprenylcistransferase [candidate division WOR-3 bacterium]TEU00498.1 MAG: di-trans,poly-cis-decaprenylcistransferase [Candidatus Stahlbacteria bacterium]
MDNVPTHIAIIMDGNGRWAKKRGLPRLQGHYAGVNAVRRVIEASLDFNIKYLTLYAFSTENWDRPKKEVNGLMRLFPKVIEEEVNRLKTHKVRMRFLGRLKELPDKVQEKLYWIEEQTKNFEDLNLIIALNYSGREELIDAVNKAVREGKVVNEEIFKGFLYLPDIPDPDLLIRTSGEVRISNFLLYEIAYTELYFTPTLWPDFEKSDLIKAIKAYQKRERKFGKVN